MTDMDNALVNEMINRLVKVVPGDPAVYDLAIYINTPVSSCLERIKKRGRDGESSYDTAYLTLLKKYYDNWVETGLEGLKVSKVRKFMSPPGEHMNETCEKILEIILDEFY